MGIGSFGGTELIIALVIILLLFGAKRIPELARGLGTGIRSSRGASRARLIKMQQNSVKRSISYLRMS